MPAYFSLYQPIPAFPTIFQPLSAYYCLFHPIQAYSSIFQYIHNVHNVHKVLNFHNFCDVKNVPYVDYFQNAQNVLSFIMFIIFIKLNMFWMFLMLLIYTFILFADLQNAQASRESGNFCWLFNAKQEKEALFNDLGTIWLNSLMVTCFCFFFWLFLVCAKELTFRRSDHKPLVFQACTSKNVSLS